MDLDGDGFRDLITGSWPGELYRFPGTADGTFAAAEKLKDKDGAEMNPGDASVVFATDWDRDGDLDLVTGCIEGYVFFVENESGTQELAFAAPVKLSAGGEEICVQRGDSGPVVADWDGDGNLDLLVGDGLGNVSWFRNAAGSGMPKLEAAQVLVKGSEKAPQDGSRCGGRTKPHVVDWNGDGRLDLLVGDFGMTPPKKKKLSDEDEFLRAGLKAEAEALQRLMEPITEEIMRAVLTEMGQPPSEEGELDLAGVFQGLNDEQRKEFGERMQSAYPKHERLQLLQKRMQEVYGELGPLEGQPQIHGHVWLFLRKPPAKAVAPKGV